MDNKVGQQPPSYGGGGYDYNNAYNNGYNNGGVQQQPSGQYYNNGQQQQPPVSYGYESQQYGKMPQYQQQQYGSGQSNGGYYAGSSVAPQYTQEAAPAGEERFQPTRGVPDMWATILYLLNMIAFVVVAANNIPVAVRTWRDNANGTSGGGSGGVQMSPITREAWVKVGYSAAVATGVAIVLCMLTTVIMRKFAKGFITFALYLSIALNFAAAALLFATGSIIGGIVFLVVAALYMWCALSWRSRIPFATIMLQTVVDVAKLFPAIYSVNIVSLLVQLIFSAVFFATLLGSAFRYENDSDRARVGVATTWLVFTFYWTTQVIKNTQHVVVAGVYATYYFLYNTAQMVSNPTMGAAGRALGRSFGSIAFGSLIVAVIQTLRYLARSAQNDRNNEGIVAILACFAACILGMLENIIEYLNEYAYTQVAIYGRSFVQAAKSTWRLIKSHGIDAIINDNLIGNVLGMTSLMVAIVSGACAFGFAKTNMPAGFDNVTAFSWIAFAIGFIIGLALNSVVVDTVNSGTKTTFVCLAEDPAALQRTKPELFNAIAQTYPQITFTRV